ncbi:hypothetical protein M513_12834 [Trichuris suis]|uniref:Uncharacterized protein n=1 Tax=Trichuris suis TaxID=68888 RepID=A0A085LMV3_9BILA|nr:hypothetical protein M513_12834 [Trichuris suis]
MPLQPVHIIFLSHTETTSLCHEAAEMIYITVEMNKDALTTYTNLLEHSGASIRHLTNQRCLDSSKAVKGGHAAMVSAVNY